MKTQTTTKPLDFDDDAAMAAHHGAECRWSIQRALEPCTDLQLRVRLEAVHRSAKMAAWRAFRTRTLRQWRRDKGGA